MNDPKTERAKRIIEIAEAIKADGIVDYIPLNRTGQAVAFINIMSKRASELSFDSDILCYHASYADLKEAHASGKTIEFSLDGETWSPCTPTWKYPVRNYRIAESACNVCAPDSPIEDPFAALKLAHEAGSKIEFETKRGEWFICAPTWIFDVSRYRIHDPYRKLKEAHAAGKIIVCKSGDSERYFVVERPKWDARVDEYRIIDPVSLKLQTPDVPEPCQNAEHMGEHACSNRHQCWEPCGELGHSAAHAVAVAEPSNV